MLNRVVLVGRLTRDPDLRYTPNGVAVANFNIASNRPFKNQDGESEADFINCVTWRKQAENLSNYMKKGSMIGVDGRLQSRSYEGKDGKMVFVTEIVAESIQFLESRNNSENTNSSQQTNYQYQQPNNQTQNMNNNPMQGSGKQVDIDDSDLPF